MIWILRKTIIFPKLRPRSLPAQQAETAIANEMLNCMICLAKPISGKVPAAFPPTKLTATSVCLNFVADLDDGKTHPLDGHCRTHVFDSGSAVRRVALFHRRVHAGR